MRSLFIIPLVLMSLLSFPSWGLTMDDLVKRGGRTAGLWYEKFTDTPFTGEVDEGREKGSIKNGKKEGYWVHYHSNGQLMNKGDYKNGKMEGYWEDYRDNGYLYDKGDYKNGKMEGYWERYWEYGQLYGKGDYKNGKKEGSWEFYNTDGTVIETHTGTYKNDVKVSD